MKTVTRTLCAGAGVLCLAWAASAAAQTAPPAAAPAAPAAPAASPMPYPAMTAPLAANPNPAVFDAGPLGKLTVDGVITGGGLFQSNPALELFGKQNKSGYGDLFNGMVIVNKTDGPVQFYVQAGAYSFPTLGTPYYKTDRIEGETYGYVPQGFVKIVPNSAISIEAGALPTLIGAEYAFTFENMNIERGLLWAQEPLISKGVQINYTKGPWAFSLAVTDGYYSDTFTAVSGLVTYTFKNSDTLTFAGEGNAGIARSVSNPLVTPIQQNNGQIYNIIYSHTQGPWTITPYFQYNSSPTVDGGLPTSVYTDGNVAFLNPQSSLSGENWSGAVLTKYNFTPEFSVAGRVEYIKSHGAANLLGYGVGSSAWTLTVTPGYQKGIFFARGEVSYVGLSNITPGLGFGADGTQTNQVRFAIESGLIF